MKTHLTKVSFALLAAAFLLGCQEKASSPVGPEGLGILLDNRGGPHPHGGGGGGGPAATTLDLDGGITTEGLGVSVKESGKKLTIGNTDFMHDIGIAFTTPGECVGIKGTKSGVMPDDGEILSLMAELNGTVTDGFFTMQIDKNGSDHLLLVERDGTFDGSNGVTRIQLGSPFDQVPNVTVTEGPTDVFTFTGPVVVWAHGVGGGNGEKSNRIIWCPGGPDKPNMVVATVNR